MNARIGRPAGISRWWILFLALIGMVTAGAVRECRAATGPKTSTVSLPNGKQATLRMLPMWGHGYTPCWTEVIGAGTSANERRLDFELKVPISGAFASRLRVQDSTTLDPAAPTARIEGAIPYVMNVDVASATWQAEDIRIYVDGKLIVRGNTSFRQQLGWIGPPVERLRILRPNCGERLSLQSIFESTGPHDNVYVASEQEAVVDAREGDNVFLLDLPLFPTSWLGYTNADIVLLSAEDLDRLEELRPEAIAALRRWAYNGGTLLLVASPEREEEVRSRFLPPAAQPVGRGTFDCETGKAQWRVYAVAWGRIMLVDRPPTMWKSGRRDLNTLGFRETPWSHDQVHVETAIPRWNLLTPMMIVGLISLYFVLLGGVSIWFFMRSKQPYLLTVLVPAAAGIVSLVGVIVPLFEDGIGVRGRIYSAAWLDQSQGGVHAVSLQTYRPGMSLGRELVFPRDVCVLPVDRPLLSRQGSYSWKFDGDRQVLGGWLQARMSSHFLVVEDEPTKARLDVESQGDTLRVTNRLGTTIRRGIVRDGEKLYVLEDLPAGETRNVPAASAEKVRSIATSLIDPAEIAGIVDSTNAPIVEGFTKLLTETGRRIREPDGGPMDVLGGGAVPGERAFLVETEKPLLCSVGTRIREVPGRSLVMGSWQ
ncbi:hypothetical protein JCM19992_07720 [Thermostilla marina]